MPLLDHFRPPLSERRHWASFHAAWATEIMRTLNRHVLPAGCFAEAHVHVGSRVEVDVAAFEQAPGAKAAEGNGGVAVQAWAPRAAALVMPAVFPDVIEVQVFRTSGGAWRVGAIELTSPGNKDRREARRAFAAKCASYLHQGVGLVVVDVVTERQANLHDELVALMEQPESFKFPGDAGLYAVAYRPGRHEEAGHIEIWPAPLQLGQPLPVLPLALRGVATVPIDLDTTYASTCADSRL